jgi:hypothetical protein
VEKKILGI